MDVEGIGSVGESEVVEDGVEGKGAMSCAEGVDNISGVGDGVMMGKVVVVVGDVEEG
jgi:hypothetical protein